MASKEKGPRVILTKDREFDFNQAVPLQALRADIPQGRYLIERRPISNTNGSKHYRVWDAHLEMFLVAKVTEDIQKLENEITALGKSEHPRIVRAYDSFRANFLGENVFLVLLQYVSPQVGLTLKDEIKKSITLPISRIKIIAEQMRDALEHIYNPTINPHHPKRLYLDIKPGNFFNTKFGLIMIDLETYDPDHFAFTPAYSSPEHVQDNVGDTRSQVYSVAAVLFEMLTHEKFFNLDQGLKRVPDMIEVLIMSLPFMMEILKLVGQDVAGLSEEEEEKCRQRFLPLAQILDKATAFNPNDRYQTLTEFYDELFPELEALAQFSL
jgi:serine/threonine protein kinase